MIESLRIQGFKSLRDVQLTLGNLNLFIGTNASGKSNFFDALRVLQGVGYGFTINEVLNGKPKSATGEVWDEIRGGSLKADYIEVGTSGNGADPNKIITLSAKMRSPEDQIVSFMVGFSAKRGCLREEALVVDDRPIYDSRDLDNVPESPVFRVKYFAGGRGRQPHIDFEKGRPVLHQLMRSKEFKAASHAKAIEACVRGLTNTQRIDPSPAILRDYSQAQIVKRMGDRGENFAALVKAVLEDEKAKEAYLGWLRQLTPAEISDVNILEGALGEPLFAVQERGSIYPAPILSDGTLRFAAIAAAFFQPDMPELLTIEEIENGIHPSRVRLLVELLRSQSDRSGRQVMATTHSPVVLSWLRPSDYPTTFLCARDEETGESRITPLTDVPQFQSIVQKQPISELFSELWLENAL